MLIPTIYMSNHSFIEFRALTTININSCLFWLFSRAWKDELMFWSLNREIDYTSALRAKSLAKLTYQVKQSDFKRSKYGRNTPKYENMQKMYRDLRPFCKWSPTCTRPAPMRRGCWDDYNDLSNITIKLWMKKIWGSEALMKNEKKLVARKSRCGMFPKAITCQPHHQKLTGADMGLKQPGGMTITHMHRMVNFTEPRAKH